MKLKFITFISLISFSGMSVNTPMVKTPPTEAKASPKTLLACLGLEEEEIHKKKATGPLYQLNQTFINYISQAPNLELKPMYFSSICLQKNEYSPSVGLLRNILLVGDQLFVSNPKSSNAFTKATHEELFQNIPHIFLTYVNNLQATMPKAGCLEEHIPEIKFFLSETKYLEEEMTMEKVLSDHKKIDLVFTGLKKYGEIQGKCKKEVMLAKKAESDKIKQRLNQQESKSNSKK